MIAASLSPQAPGVEYRYRRLGRDKGDNADVAWLFLKSWKRDENRRRFGGITKDGMLLGTIHEIYGDEIVQEYRDGDGTLNQWIFSEITPKSFHWIGRSSKDDGKGWDVETEFFARRREMKAES
jgi:hypothetical protein